MKKASLLMVLVILGILVLGASAALAASPVAENNAQACGHASPVAENNANENSVLSSCNGGGGPGG